MDRFFPRLIVEPALLVDRIVDPREVPRLVDARDGVRLDMATASAPPNGPPQLLLGNHGLHSYLAALDGRLSAWQGTIHHNVVLRAAVRWSCQGGDGQLRPQPAYSRAVALPTLDCTDFVT